MNKKVVIIAIALVIGIFCFSQFSDEPKEKVDNKNAYTVQNYANAGGGNAAAGKNTYTTNYNYTTRSTVKTTCSACKGSGSKICSGCNGAGKTYRTKNSVNFGNGAATYTVSSKCVQCNGNGTTTCIYCGGTGMLS